MSKKKKKKVISKRRTQAKVKKQKKAKSRRLTSNVKYIERPAISEIDTPDGFRAVSMSQGIIEYAKPIMNFVENGVLKDINDALQIAMPLWNFNLSRELGDSKFNRQDILREIGKALKLNTQESLELFEMMIQRKEYLFPEEIQPDNPMTMFVRQEEQYLISEFNYSALNLSKKPYLPDDVDMELIQLINLIDKYISEDSDYDEWEDHYILMEEKCKRQFNEWLNFKGLEEYSKEFPYHIGIYLKFIYHYMHDDPINLKTVLPVYIEEFFADHILRKVMAEPTEYIEWPPALKLFYNFLNEIGYLENAKQITKILDEIEPHFIEILRKIYS